MATQVSEFSQIVVSSLAFDVVVILVLIKLNQSFDSSSAF